MSTDSGFGVTDHHGRHRGLPVPRDLPKYHGHDEAPPPPPEPPAGACIVLTADRTLMAGYRLLFDGMLAASQTTTTPYSLLRAFMLPRSRGEHLRAKFAPLGLRRVEAALVADGFARGEVLVVDEANLARAIGPNTRVVGISTGEPLGIGMSTTTMCAIAGGRSYPSVLFLRLLRIVHRAIHAAGTRTRVLVGGPGAWQLADRPELRHRLGVDHVVTGYAEATVAEVFRTLSRSNALPEVLAGKGLDATRLPRILGASTMGVVEISRGCGLGCSFCTIAGTPMQHLPAEIILADVRTNLAAGNRNVCVISEDLFRYGGDGVRVRPAALLALLAQLRELDGLGLIQTDHANVVSVSQYSDDELVRVRELLVGPTGQQYPWVNVGVETASGALLRANGCAPKMGAHGQDDWAGLCSEQLLRLCRAGFFPMVSLVVGLPGETEDDVLATLAWVESLHGERLAVFPVLFAPIDGSFGPSARSLSPLQWRLIRTCYALNFKWVPRMYWDNQRAAGVGLPKRCLMQLLGRGQTLLWKSLLALRARSSTRSARPDPVEGRRA